MAAVVVLVIAAAEAVGISILTVIAQTVETATAVAVI